MAIEMYFGTCAAAAESRRNCRAGGFFSGPEREMEHGEAGPHPVIVIP